MILLFVKSMWEFEVIIQSPRGKGLSALNSFKKLFKEPTKNQRISKWLLHSTVSSILFLKLLNFAFLKNQPQIKLLISPQEEGKNRTLGYITKHPRLGWQVSPAIPTLQVAMEQRECFSFSSKGLIGMRKIHGGRRSEFSLYSVDVWKIFLPEVLSPCP